METSPLSSDVTSSGSPAGVGSGSLSDGGGGVGAASAAWSLSLKLPPGYRFSPTNAELVVHFLRPKLAGEPLPLPVVFDVRILDYHPEQLVDKYREHGEDRWFFFTRRERKHDGGTRPNRTTVGNGHWNATGSLKAVRANGELVGCVRALVFYETSRKKKDIVADDTEAASPNKDNGKTDWTMYEYDSLTSQAEFDANKRSGGRTDVLVLCTIQKKKHCVKKKEGEEVKGKKKKREEEEEEEKGTSCAGNSDKKSGHVKGQDQDSSHVGSISGSEKKSTQVVRKKGSPAVGTKRRKSKKEIAQEQDSYLVKIPQPQHEPMRTPLGEVVNTDDPGMDMLHCSVAGSSLPMSCLDMLFSPGAGSSLPMSCQDMLFSPVDGTESNMSHPNYMMHHSFNNPTMEFLQRQTLQENYLPYEHHNMQHMKLNTVAPPEVYSPGLGAEYPSYGYGNGDHLLGTNMDYHEL